MVVRSTFIDRHIGPNDYQINSMLLELGYKSLTEFIQAVVPKNILLTNEIEKVLPVGISENSAISELKSIADENIFKGIDSPYSVVRYHSLIIEKDSLPDELKITGVLKDNPEIIMAIEHKEKPIYGVQFHPESIETDFGMKLIENFLAL